MKNLKLTLPVVGLAILLTALAFLGSGSAQAEESNAAAAAHGDHAAAANATPTIGPTIITPTGTKPVAKTPADLLKLLGERIVAKDVEGVIALQEPEAAIVNFDLTVIRGHKAIREFYIEWFKSNPVLTVNPGQIVIAGGQRSTTDPTKVVNRSASIMGNYTLEQDAEDGTRTKFSGNFCDIVREQPNGTWLYVQDNPYPPHH